MMNPFESKGPRLESAPMNFETARAEYAAARESLERVKAEGPRMDKAEAKVRAAGRSMVSALEREEKVGGEKKVIAGDYRVVVGYMNQNGEETERVVETGMYIGEDYSVARVKDWAMARLYRQNLDIKPAANGFTLVPYRIVNVVDQSVMIPGKILLDNEGRLVTFRDFLDPMRKNGHDHPLTDFSAARARIQAVEDERRKIFDEYGPLSRSLPEEEYSQRWEVGVVPKLKRLKERIRQLSVELAQALEKENSRGSTERAEPGTYTFILQFPTSEKEELVYPCNPLQVSETQIKTVADVKKNARGYISSLGIHNFGLKVNREDGWALVGYTLTNQQHQDLSIHSNCLVDASGHLATRSRLGA